MYYKNQNKIVCNKNIIVKIYKKIIDLIIDNADVVDSNSVALIGFCEILHKKYLQNSNENVEQFTNRIIENVYDDKKYLRSEINKIENFDINEFTKYFIDEIFAENNANGLEPDVKVGHNLYAHDATIIKMFCEMFDKNISKFCE